MHGESGTHQGAPPPPVGDETPAFISEDGRFSLYQGDCLELLPLLPDACVDMIFADPPYFLSNGGITCHAGKMVSVNKGKWDRSRGFEDNYRFTRDWLRACQPVLRPNGTIWISGTSHIIHIVGCCLDQLGYKILNDITWVKPAPPPNLSCRYFTHATETIIWAGRDKKCRHKFNYSLMKGLNGGKQMKSVWTIHTPRKDEKVFGKHPTQKPLALLERIIAASTDEDDLILDPFSGSATTGIAAARMNRQSVGLEMESQFLDVGVHRFVGVPQADNPDRILHLVKAYATDNPTPDELTRLLRITERQVHYYKQAAEMLGLLRRSKETWALTDIGKEICTGDEALGRSLLARRVLEMPVVQTAIRRSRRYRTKAARCRIIAELLSRTTPLSSSTCMRRAQTLLAWMGWAQAQPDASHERVSRAAEEIKNAAVTKKLKLPPDLGPAVPVDRVQNRQLAPKSVHLFQ